MKVLLVLRPTKLSTYDVVPVYQDYKGMSKLFKLFLEFLGPHDYEVFYLEDPRGLKKLSAWEGPIVAVGTQIEHILMVQNIPCTSIPFPDPNRPAATKGAAGYKILQRARDYLNHFTKNKEAAKSKVVRA
jgi:hypothetical protein